MRCICPDCGEVFMTSEDYHNHMDREHRPKVMSGLKVHITLTAGVTGGKTHLAQALRRFLSEEYDTATPLDVTIIEQYPQDGSMNVVTGTTFIVHPDPRRKGHG